MSGETPTRPARKYKQWSVAEEHELCELYWTIPATKLAARYGVSPQRLRDKASKMQIANERVKARNRAAQAVEEAPEAKQRTANGHQTIKEKPGGRVIIHTMR